MSRSEFWAGTGGHRSWPSGATTVQHYGVRRRRFLFVGTNLILPDRGSPL